MFRILCFGLKGSDPVRLLPSAVLSQIGPSSPRRRRPAGFPTGRLYVGKVYVAPPYFPNAFFRAASNSSPGFHVGRVGLFAIERVA